jgi:mono/diheme cytochrome c family protein
MKRGPRLKETVMRVGKARLCCVVLAAALAAAWGWTGRADDPPAPKRAPAGNAALVERGAYLVNEVARCGDCHTPRDARGRLDNSRRLQGAPTWFTPKVRAGEWEGRAPDLTSSGRGGRWSEARMVKLLTTGGDPDPPMPAYHLTREDARAVAAYLRSLPGRKQGAGREREREGRRRDGGDKGRRRERERD